MSNNKPEVGTTGWIALTVMNIYERVKFSTGEVKIGILQ